MTIGYLRGDTLVVHKTLRAECIIPRRNAGCVNVFTFGVEGGKQKRDERASSSKHQADAHRMEGTGVATRRSPRQILRFHKTEDVLVHII